MRILFADDDRELCRASRTLLEHEGYTVETVYNGEDALEMASTMEMLPRTRMVPWTDI